MNRTIPHPEPDGITLAGVLQALSDPVRLEIVRIAAARDELPCSAFSNDIPKSTMSHHWRVLREAGVIRQCPNGTARLISLRRAELEARFPGLLDAVLRSVTPPPASAGRVSGSGRADEPGCG